MVNKMSEPKSYGLYPKHKHKREHKIRILRNMLKDPTEPIDKLLARFCLMEDVTLRHLREEYIRLLLISGEISKDLFEGSKLITKKFLTRCTV